MGVPLLRLLFRKMWNTKWLTFSTLLGLIVAVSFTVSIPMYSDGSLKRVVSSTLKGESEGLPAGSLIMSYQAPGGTKTDIGGLKAVDEYIVNEVPKEIGFPHETYVNTRSIRSTEVYPVDPTKVDASRTRTMTLSSMSGLQDHVELSGGKMFSEKASGDTIEALMLEEAMYRQDLHVGDVMEYPVSGGSGITLKVKSSACFSPKRERSVLVPGF
ncbi:hypothetical protein HMSSN036_21280 [Paenibacillus macerans]|nr:hypothetical protein HMSSN036_21280 [Paenibacillus macerans]